MINQNIGDLHKRMQHQMNENNEDVFIAFKKKMTQLLESPRSEDGLKRGVTNFTDYKKKKRTAVELQAKIIQMEKEKEWFKHEALFLSKS